MVKPDGVQEMEYRVVVEVLVVVVEVEVVVIH